MTESLRVAVTGSTGLIGSALVRHLTEAGVPVLPVRRTAAGDFDREPLRHADAVIHLAGETIAGRWSRAKMERILRSRVEGTRGLVRIFGELPRPPRTFLCASAVGFYGDRGNQELTEESSPGTGFLSDVCRQWEEAARTNLPSSTRLVHLRFGVVLSLGGGALRKLLVPARLGLAGPLGRGDQFMSWISIRDAVGLIGHVIRNDRIHGPLNVVSPAPVTNRDFIRTLNRVLRRPTAPALPAPLLRLLLGRFADETLLASARVIPRTALDDGWSFEHPALERALRALLGRER